MSACSEAIHILDFYWDKELPVNLEAIATQLGVTVEKCLKIDDDWDISGKFTYVNGNPVCFVNTADIETRQRFTLAHELGHFVLRHGEHIDRTDSLYRNNNEYQDWREVEANIFAAELTMPRSALDFLIMKKNITRIDDLAREFGMSERAMYYRLKNTGWLND
ncbi:ImmA/IrrE family metallo-endopeptidase [Phocoenobacter atlanticus]|uniref:ImmA/IrrE family metallo-endopeptidase n=1 Tax=Phocoenobacter atlanticus TaxID=3416742 RepID=UPI00276306AA|nr:ImmA/IrrE family metallo-endopeptidase [Pasteurella atlantica]MDP8100697.1 ImmA/IrrE family metallo-endopeptidase [Pasteurella atlantica]